MNPNISPNNYWKYIELSKDFHVNEYAYFYIISFDSETKKYTHRVKKEKIIAIGEGGIIRLENSEEQDPKYIGRSTYTRTPDKVYFSERNASEFGEGEAFNCNYPQWKVEDK